MRPDDDFHRRERIRELLRDPHRLADGDGLRVHHAPQLGLGVTEDRSVHRDALFGRREHRVADREVRVDQNPRRPLRSGLVSVPLRRLLGQVSPGADVQIEARTAGDHHLIACEETPRHQEFGQARAPHADTARLLQQR
jgi:hypothetical protein